MQQRSLFLGKKRKRGKEKKRLEEKGNILFKNTHGNLLWAKRLPLSLLEYL